MCQGRAGVPERFAPCVPAGRPGLGLGIVGREPGGLGNDHDMWYAIHHYICDAKTKKSPIIEFLGFFLADESILCYGVRHTDT